MQFAKNLIKGARITINAGTGEPTVEFGLNYIHDNIETILNLPQSLAERKKKKLSFVLMNFKIFPGLKDIKKYREGFVQPGNIIRIRVMFCTGLNRL